MGYGGSQVERTATGRTSGSLLHRVARLLVVLSALAALVAAASVATGPGAAEGTTLTSPGAHALVPATSTAPDAATAPSPSAELPASAPAAVPLATMPTWSVRASYPEPVDTAALSCPTATTCFAVGSTTILATTDAGAHWARQSVPDGVLDLSGVSCASTDQCVAVGESSASNTDAVVLATSNG